MWVIGLYRLVVIVVLGSEFSVEGKGFLFSFVVWGRGGTGRGLIF